MDCLTINYTFNRDVAEPIRYRVAIGLPEVERVHQPPTEAPAWCRVGPGHNCPCNLDLSRHAYCAAALSLVDLIDIFGPLLSYEEVDVTVETQERTIHRRTSVQKALSSLVGLHMATSGCAHLAPLKPLARFHLPFATREETLFRVAGAYLLAQYFLDSRNGNGADLSLEGLHRIYGRIQEVNRAMAERMREVAAGDANINAIVLLDMLAQNLPLVIEERLAEFEYLFQPYFDALQTEGETSAP